MKVARQPAWHLGVARVIRLQVYKMNPNWNLGRNYSLALCMSLLFQFMCIVLLVFMHAINGTNLFLSAFVFYWLSALLLVAGRGYESALRLVYVALGFPPCLLVSGLLWYYFG